MREDSTPERGDSTGHGRPPSLGKRRQTAQRRFSRIQVVSDILLRLQRTLNVALKAFTLSGEWRLKRILKVTTDGALLL